MYYYDSLGEMDAWRKHPQPSAFHIVNLLGLNTGADAATILDTSPQRRCYEPLYYSNVPAEAYRFEDHVDFARNDPVITKFVCDKMIMDDIVTMNYEKFCPRCQVAGSQYPPEDCPSCRIPFVYRCFSCDCEYFNNSAFWLHLRGAIYSDCHRRQVYNFKEQNFACRICETSFQSSLSLRKHRLDHAVAEQSAEASKDFIPDQRESLFMEHKSLNVEDVNQPGDYMVLPKRSSTLDLSSVIEESIVQTSFFSETESCNFSDDDDVSEPSLIIDIGNDSEEKNAHRDVAPIPVEQLERIDTYSCANCGSTHASRTVYENHVNVCERRRADEPAAELPSDDNSIDDDDFYYVQKYREDLSEDDLKRLIERRCAECDDDATPYAFVDWRCVECGKSHATYEDAIDHFRKICSLKQACRCSRCDFETDSAFVVRRHLRQAHGARQVSGVAAKRRACSSADARGNSVSFERHQRCEFSGKSEQGSMQYWLEVALDQDFHGRRRRRRV